MHRILLINPNTSTATTQMMVAIAQACLPPAFEVVGATADLGVPMIVTPVELAASAAQVDTQWRRAGGGWAGVIVACFGDPGVRALRQHAGVPVIGIGEAAMRDAGARGRRFGIATTTGELAADIQALAEALGLVSQYTGLRVTAGDPHVLVRSPERLNPAMAEAIDACVRIDGAQAVVVGGGPLGQVADALADRCGVPLVAPLAAAARLLQAQLQALLPPDLGAAARTPCEPPRRPNQGPIPCSASASSTSATQESP